MGVAGKDKAVDVKLLLSYDVSFSELFFLLYNTLCKCTLSSSSLAARYVSFFFTTSEENN